MLLQRSFLTSWFSKITLILVGIFTPLVFASAVLPEGGTGTPQDLEGRVQTSTGETVGGGSNLRQGIFDTLNEAAFGTYSIDTSVSPESVLTSRLGAGVNLAIGALGVVAVILIIYAGFLWLTAGGNSDQVQKAIRIIKSVVVGIIIVSLAYAIIAFVLSAIPTSEAPSQESSTQE